MLTVTKMEGRRYLIYIVEDKDNGREVLSVMRKDFLLSSRKIKSVKYSDIGILLDGERVNVRQRLRSGQVLLILLDDVTESCTEIIDYPLDIKILYEDEDFIFIDKPSGWVCHPSQGHYIDSLTNAVCAYLHSKGENTSIHLLGRLDKDTSGIVGFAKNSVIQELMDRQRQQGDYRKEYLALVHGCPTPECGEIAVSIKEETEEDGRHTHMVAAEDELSKSAHTRYMTEIKGENVSLLRVVITTGRTHQIRVHMSNHGNPLVGDMLYGGEKIYNMERAALHAHIVRFTHPISGKAVELNAEVPEDMKKIISFIEKC